MAFTIMAQNRTLAAHQPCATYVCRPKEPTEVLEGPFPFPGIGNTPWGSTNTAPSMPVKRPSVAQYASQKGKREGGQTGYGLFSLVARAIGAAPQD